MGKVKLGAFFVSVTVAWFVLWRLIITPLAQLIDRLFQIGGQAASPDFVHTFIGLCLLFTIIGAIQVGAEVVSIIRSWERRFAPRRGYHSW